MSLALPVDLFVSLLSDNGALPIGVEEERLPGLDFIRRSPPRLGTLAETYWIPGTDITGYDAPWRVLPPDFISCYN
jgi:hypothetical protein